VVYVPFFYVVSDDNFFINESSYLVGFFRGIFVISFSFDFFYLRVYCIGFCTGYRVFLLLDSGCSLSALLVTPVCTNYAKYCNVLYDVVGIFLRSCDIQERGCYIFVGMVMAVYLAGCFIYYYNGYVFIIWSNMGLCVSVKVSFVCNLCLLKLYI
jgi:hypothetical protein